MENLGLEANEEILEIINQRDQEVLFTQKFKKNLEFANKYSKADLIAIITTHEVFLNSKNLESDFKKFKKWGKCNG